MNLTPFRRPATLLLYLSRHFTTTTTTCSLKHPPPPPPPPPFPTTINAMDLTSPPPEEPPPTSLPPAATASPPSISPHQTRPLAASTPHPQPPPHQARDFSLCLPSSKSNAQPNRPHKPRSLAFKHPRGPRQENTFTRGVRLSHRPSKMPRRLRSRPRRPGQTRRHQGTFGRSSCCHCSGYNHRHPRRADIGKAKKRTRSCPDADASEGWEVSPGFDGGLRHGAKGGCESSGV
ncbi:hypothetical protein QC764_111490 [Podospora pseudoanserina]|uniref:Uncharacterized protein n=1 Tax=Podospora pseudoanserina TaxID=2609844 RepID=A0ABR0IP08_9PEZI|nr:hypothetical protein QC764_111490 [Podospora pseudoanserina]